MLSCSCDNDDADWFYDDTLEVAPLATKRMRRCCSCKDRIAVGDDCKPFPRWRTVSYYSDPARWQARTSVDGARPRSVAAA